VQCWATSRARGAATARPHSSQAGWSRNPRPGSGVTLLPGRNQSFAPRRPNVNAALRLKGAHIGMTVDPRLPRGASAALTTTRTGASLPPSVLRIRARLCECDNAPGAGVVGDSYYPAHRISPDPPPNRRSARVRGTGMRPHVPRSPLRTQSDRPRGLDRFQLSTPHHAPEGLTQHLPPTRGLLSVSRLGDRPRQRS
jgi:hypothetical protein